VIALRDALLVAWERFRAAAAAAAAGSPEDGTDHGKEADGHSAEVRVLYADLISQVRYVSGQTRSPRASRPARARGSVGASRVVARR
jgi:hypothetical protein